MGFIWSTRPPQRVFRTRKEILDATRPFAKWNHPRQDHRGILHLSTVPRVHRRFTGSYAAIPGTKLRHHHGQCSHSQGPPHYRSHPFEVSPYTLFYSGIILTWCPRGMRVLFLPPYSPDFNPIELAFSSIKSFVRRHQVLSYKVGVQGPTFTFNAIQAWYSQIFTALGHLWVFPMVGCYFTCYIMYSTLFYCSNSTG